MRVDQIFVLPKHFTPPSERGYIYIDLADKLDDKIVPVGTF